MTRDRQDRCGLTMREADERIGATKEEPCGRRCGSACYSP
jgi:hypothetical protein